MFGLKLFQEIYVERLEKELEYYRKRFDEERIRADRLHDALMVSSGQLPVTETVREAIEEHRESQGKLIEKQKAEAIEMFGEELGDFEKFDGLELPDDLREEAAAMIENAKKAK